MFFFNDTATTELYTLSLHDALPIWYMAVSSEAAEAARQAAKTYGAKTESSSTTARGPVANSRARSVARATNRTEIGKHTSELQSPDHLVCRLLLEKKKNK